MIEASGRSGYSRYPEDMMPIKSSTSLLHKWQFLWVRGPKSSQVRSAQKKLDQVMINFELVYKMFVFSKCRTSCKL